jgi:hypothetical protein
MCQGVSVIIANSSLDSYSKVFETGRLSQPSLVFLDKVKDYLRRTLTNMPLYPK